MKLNFATSCFVIATLLSSGAALAADAGGQPTPVPAAAKDPEKAANIKERLGAETTVDLTQVTVAADQAGTVVLSGKVETRTAEEKAVSLARATEGVKVVTSRIQILKPD